jgi:mRNA interferase RelE/StbE
MPRIELSRQAAKFLGSVPAKHGMQISRHLLALQAAPDDIVSAELKGYAPYRRMKSGEYRIVYYLEKDTIFVALIGKRNDDDIYKQLQRLLK